MNQLRSFAVTDTSNAFRQGATAYRNARDWAKEHRDAAISCANLLADRTEPEGPADDAGASPAPSFVTAEETEETPETYRLMQESRMSLNEETDPLSEYQESDVSIEELTGYTLPAKRSTRRSIRQQTQRKRHHAVRSSSTGHNDGCTLQTGASTQPSWVWDTDYQKYRYWNCTKWVWQ